MSFDPLTDSQRARRARALEAIASVVIATVAVPLLWFAKLMFEAVSCAYDCGPAYGIAEVALIGAVVAGSLAVGVAAHRRTARVIGLVVSASIGLKLSAEVLNDLADLGDPRVLLLGLVGAQLTTAAVLSFAAVILRATGPRV